jgi:hypothetical protein
MFGARSLTAVFRRVMSKHPFADDALQMTIAGRIVALLLL